MKRHGFTQRSKTVADRWRSWNGCQERGGGTGISSWAHEGSRIRWEHPWRNGTVPCEGCDDRRHNIDSIIRPLPKAMGEMGDRGWQMVASAGVLQQQEEPTEQVCPETGAQ